MAEGFNAGDPFASLEGKDGFHVVKTEAGNTHVLSCLAYGGGRPFNLVSNDPNDASVEILELSNPTPAQLGALDRLHLVLDAVCRYLTTGGQWRELDNALKDVEKVARGGLRFPGYHLCATYSTTDGTYQHIFVKDGTTDAVLWNEPEVGDSGLPVGGWIEPTTLERLREQQENDNEVWTGGRRRVTEITEEEARAAGGPTDLLQLPPGGSAQTPGDAEGGGGPRVPGQEPGG